MAKIVQCVHQTVYIQFLSKQENPISHQMLLHLAGTTRLVLDNRILVEVIQPLTFPRSSTLLFPFQEAEPQMEGAWIPELKLRRNPPGRATQ